MTQPSQMIRPRFFLARRCTRWDVYPQRQPIKAIAVDYYGFWERDEKGVWFLTPVSYNPGQPITEEEANAYPIEGEM